MMTARVWVCVFVFGCASAAGVKSKTGGETSGGEKLPPEAEGAETPPAPPPSCPAMAAALLSNGDFESGPTVAWYSGSDSGEDVIRPAEFLTIAPQSGGWAAWLGGYSAPEGYGVAYDGLGQSLMVAAGERLQITGYRFVESDEEGEEYDTLQVTLRDPSGARLEVLKDSTIPACVRRDCTWSNEDATAGWVPFTLNASGAYAGRVIAVEFQAVLDESYVTNFLFDGVQAHVTACP